MAEIRVPEAPAADKKVAGVNSIYAVPVQTLTPDKDR
jgi:hypothetical protein